MAYITPASNDKPTCTDYVYFGNWQDRRGQFAWSKNDLKNLDVKLKFFQGAKNKDIWLADNFIVG